MSALIDHMPHIVECRQRIVRCVAFFFALFIPLIFLGKQSFHFIALPLIRQLPEGSQMIATQVFSTFTVPLKLSLFISLLITIPFGLYQIWAFVAPGLYPHEKKRLSPILWAAIGLFYIGAAFAFFVVCPMALHFFINMLPPSVAMMTDIGSYFNFIFSLTLAFGCAFQVPVVVITLIRLNIIQTQTLARARRYIIVGAFTLGMLLTPPDVLSQILLAIPLWVLFELGLWWGAKGSQKHFN